MLNTIKYVKKSIVGLPFVRFDTSMLKQLSTLKWQVYYVLYDIDAWKLYGGGVISCKGYCHVLAITTSSMYDVRK